ncbi:MAG: hypothetical protein R6X02_30310 [Enhygromyxa sp.]
MPNVALLSIAALLAIAPADSTGLDLDAEGLDPAALEAGLRVRVGDELERWVISVERETATRYRVELRRAGSRPDRRTVTLEGASDEDRSRELAAMLAVIIDEADEPRAGAGAGADDPGPRSLSRPIGFVALESHVGLGPPRDPDPHLGLGLGGGAWLLDDHLQPRVRVGWSHSWAGALDVHQVHAGIGLAGGVPLGQFWFGALVLPAFKWTYARQVRASSAWFGGGEISVIAQYRSRRFVLGLRSGIETTFPAARAPGTREVIRWGHIRWLAVFEVGFGV